MARDHGGNLADACARFGGDAGAWLDLSTGINPVAYPVGDLAQADWSRLPDEDALGRLIAAARDAWNVPDAAELVPAPGASALIRLMPRLDRAAAVAIPAPTYNEHAAAYRAEGWQLSERPGAATRAAVIVNPNNPDGRCWERHELATLAEALPRLVVDESFMDATPQRSLVGDAGDEGLVILRSFGKFYGLAGLRLGFAIAGPRTASRLRDLLGPWAVSGPALAIGARALRDGEWQRATRARVARDVRRLVQLGQMAGWNLVGEAGLFATFDTPDAEEAQTRLARSRIWSRRFPYSDRWLRLGLPGDEAAWDRLGEALEVR
ncbi:threonine-phosphate decarboxylase [Limibaculum sp. M0105]|uniref:threonine-phosphate decarboxylase n=1 Tax=Thermohalobaculum xanthum TaxID=2753746 RepID=A0A8J7M4S8_9RHOB|nr:threonine-phosphate decarboxylase CobD [Thermohalobaculum xanthum]MBK0397657.1 threonine-phosphate decarboxylase [Thermohalobaculum xanthum]